MTARGKALKAKLLGTAGRFGRAEDGVIAAWFAIVLVPLLGFTFGAIKFTQLSEQRSGMTDAMDAAGLALARYPAFAGVDDCDLAQGDEEADKKARAAAKRYAHEYFYKNYPEHDQLYADEDLTVPFDPEVHMTFDLTCNVYTLNAIAWSDMGGALGGYFGVGAVKLDLSSQIALPSAGKVELALVLDVSGSMNGCVEVTTEDDTCPESRIAGLKKAVTKMMDGLYGTGDNAKNEFVRTSVVPFNSIVNANPDAFKTNPEWFDTDAKNPFHGMNFLHVERDITKGEDWRQITTGGKKVNHFDLFRSLPDDEKEADWAGCTEARPFPLDELVGPPGEGLDATAYADARKKPEDFEQDARLANTVKNRINKAWKNNEIPNPGRSSSHLSALANGDASRFVPWFYPDEPDCWYAARRDDCANWQPDQITVDERDILRPWKNIYTGLEQGNLRWFYLLENPRNGGDDEWSYANGSFIRDTSYTDVIRAGASKVPESKWYGVHGTEQGAKDYYHYTLEYRNTVGGADASDNCEGSFAAFASDGYVPEAEMLKHAQDIGATSCSNDEYKMRQAYPGVYDEDEKKYVGKYDQYKYDMMYNWRRKGRSASSGGPNLRCGPALLPLTVEKKKVMTLIDGLNASGGTNSAEGIAWGWRMLSNLAPYPEAVDPDTNAGRKWRKIAVLMTDGQNNINKSDTHMESPMSAYGFMLQDRLDINEENMSEYQKRIAYFDEMDSKTIRICHRMQAEGIRIYTIGYAIENSSTGNKIRDMLKACANHPENSKDESTFFDAGDADQLQTVFDEITKQIVELHITG